jgi:hypothetical protein
MYTLSDAGAAAADRNPREWDVEISRWGDPSSKNARYVVQPAYQNTVWFVAPPGVLAHEVRWEAARVRMTTVCGAGKGGDAVADHTFKSGLPEPGDEKFRIAFYDFQRGPQPLQHGAEIVIQRFEYLP